MKNRRQLGTSHGMRRWHSTIPRCKTAKCKTRLVNLDYREIGLCSSCQKIINEHREMPGGWFCPATRRQTDSVWNNQDKLGLFNSCPLCTGDIRTISEHLEDIEKERVGIN